MAILTRSLNRFGDGGLAVLIPKPWLEQHGLKARDKVEITERDGQLVILPLKAGERPSSKAQDR